MFRALSSIGGAYPLPSIIFHDEPRHRFDLLLFIDETPALIPAPRLFIFAHAAQLDFIRQLLAREREQPPSEILTLILRRDEQLVEIHVRLVQRQPCRKINRLVRDEQPPALFHLERDPRAQLRQEKIAGLPDSRRNPAV